MNMAKFNDEDLVKYIRQLQREMDEVPEENRGGKTTFMQRMFGLLKAHDKL